MNYKQVGGAVGLVGLLLAGLAFARRRREVTHPAPADTQCPRCGPIKRCVMTCEGPFCAECGDKMVRTR